MIHQRRNASDNHTLSFDTARLLIFWSEVESGKHGRFEVFHKVDGQLGHEDLLPIAASSSKRVRSDDDVQMGDVRCFR